MKKIKIAFVKFGGLSLGGTEKHLQILSAYLPRDKFDVTYFYCDSAPYIGSNYIHPDTDPHRLQWMKDNGVNLVKFDVQYKDVRVPTHDWVNTNFWELFNEEDFDIIQTGRAGHAEYPFTHINKIHQVDCITLPDMAESKSNVRKVVLISNDQLQGWKRCHTSEPEKAIEIPLLSFLEEENVKTNYRKKLGISKDTVVYGMHQRPNDGIFSPMLIESYSKFKDEDVALVILGGSDLYKQQAKNLGIKNVHFLETSADSNVIHGFLNTLDVYTHARHDGETQGCVLVEAMFHGLPIVTHTAPAMGHKDTMGPSGFMCNNADEYFEKMKLLLNDKERKKYVELSQTRYKEAFSLNHIVDSYVNIYEEIML
ncbi:MAG: glycosyltransferase family 4 protein [Proteobacteria bacterium]|nr:glycosyltransferase family 4 protein [Pseudomonadota bacterium]